MYLHAERYVGGWDHNNDFERLQFARTLTAMGLQKTDVADHSPHLTVSICAAYWRKANAIHAWFVRNVQDGNDNCHRYGVERDQLQELLDACHATLADPSLAGELLPPRSGFFFGSTALDEGYFEDLKDTVAQLSAIIANPRLGEFHFYYQSSW